jgi:hypothetical protein
MTKVLYKDEWVTLSFDAATRLMRYTRSDVPYATLADMDRSHAALGAAVPHIAPGTKLLIDVRLAHPRNDAEFEAKTNSALTGFLKPFAKHATLLRTAVGKLQTARLARARGTTSHAFDDEAKALAYLEIDNG